MFSMGWLPAGCNLTDRQTPSIQEDLDMWIWEPRRLETGSQIIVTHSDTLQQQSLLSLTLASRDRKRTASWCRLYARTQTVGSMQLIGIHQHKHRAELKDSERQIVNATTAICENRPLIISIQNAARYLVQHVGLLCFTFADTDTV